jgi:hypothetical protein
LKPWVEPLLQVQVSSQVCLEGYEHRPLLTADQAMEYLVEILYAGRLLQRKDWEKYHHNTEIYQRYLAGEDSVMLARAYGLSDRRVRSIIERERHQNRQ